MQRILPVAKFLNRLSRENVRRKFWLKYRVPCFVFDSCSSSSNCSHRFLELRFWFGIKRCFNFPQSWYDVGNENYLNSTEIQGYFGYVHSMNTYLIYDSPTLEIGANRNRAAKPFLCVNRSPIQYDFWGGTKPIRYRVNIPFVFF